MKIYKLNNIQKRQQQQKLTNMTSNFQYKNLCEHQLGTKKIVVFYMYFS